MAKKIIGNSSSAEARRADPSDAPLEMLEGSRADDASLSHEEALMLIHEFRARQKELENQNHELRRAQIDLSHSRDRYFDLFQSAPVACVTLDREGVVTDANQMAATLLGTERADVIGHRLVEFLSEEAQDAWRLHRCEVFSGEGKKSCELAIKRADGSLMTVRLESLAAGDDDGSLAQCRTAMVRTTMVRVREEKRAWLGEEKSEQRFCRLMNAVIDHIFTVRIDCNGVSETLHAPNCELITGYSPDELVESPCLWASMIPPEDLPLVEEHIRRTLAGEQPSPLEHRIVRKDGGVRWVLRIASPQLNAQGRMIAYDGLLQDITERKVAEDALHSFNIELQQSLADCASERDEGLGQIRLLSEAVSNLHEGVLVTSDNLELPGRQIVFVNDAMCRITGYTSEELIGASPRMLQGDGTDATTLTRIKAELSKGRSWIGELINYRKDGTPYNAELFITPLFDDRGTTKKFVAIHRDISQRKQAERALRDREERLRAILNAASDAIINIDQRGIITNVNPATEQMFGYTQDELVGENVKILMPSPYREAHDGWIARYLQSGEAHIIGNGREVVGRRKDGSTFPAALAVSEVERLGLFSGIIRDISERKKLQRDVLKIAEDEQRRMGRDLHDGTQQELAGLGMLAQTLRDNLIKSDQSEFGGVAARIVEGIARTHREVQAISRGYVPVSLEGGGLMDALRDLASRTDGLEGITCAFKCNGVEIANDLMATHLYRIAQEAVANALKHGRPTHVLIALQSKNGYLVLQVADDGCGFEMTDQYEGMGLKTIAYRAGLIGAALTVTPVDVGGTLVTCEVLEGEGGLR